ncbi:protoporphyrinogen oxidase [Corynebacterium matruchotii]|uniref:protoporphyrinogen oxidase n=1 Tax=Corynebacterium matruchotii TaxID=43768 RepID=UPI0028ECC4A3|nr:protoporphyrinogen oxidase [Corynebacterium matruchotii]
MRVAIIGAGLSGLTAAWEIHHQRPDVEIEIFEAADRIGGKLYTVPFTAGPTDMGAEAYLAIRADATQFFTQLGLRDELVKPSGLPSLLYFNDAVHEMPRNTVMGIPASGSTVAKLVDIHTQARIDDETDQPGIAWVAGVTEMSLGGLVRARYGDQIVDRLVSVFQGGVFSCISDDLGIRATIPQLAQTFDDMASSGEKVTLSGAVNRILERQKADHTKHAKNYRPQVFGAFRQGYQQLYETLAEQSEATIHIDAFISGVAKKPQGFVLKGAGSGFYDRVLFATPAPTAAMLVKDIMPAAEAPLKAVKLASSVVVGMKFASDEGLPDNSGILVATNEPGVKAKAFTFSSKKWPHIGARGGALVRASFGRFGDDAITRWAEDALVDQALDDLRTITGFDGRAAGLDEIYVQRWFGGLPVYSPTHLATVAEIEAVVADTEDVEIAGSFMRGVGVPAVIADARAAAHRLLK